MGGMPTVVDYKQRGALMRYRLRRMTCQNKTAGQFCMPSGFFCFKI